MIIEKSIVSDVDEILSLQKLAYISEAKIYNDYNIPPLLQTKEESIDDFNNQIILRCIVAGKIVGSVRAYSKNATCYIGKLIVHPEYQNNGIATKLMSKIENIFGSCKRYELFTGHKSEKNIYLYQKLGYKIFDTKKVNDSLNLVFMEKYVVHRA